jgi:hypothetical protein
MINANWRMPHKNGLDRSRAGLSRQDFDKPSRNGSYSNLPKK